jgi:hypothetical protein
MPTCSQKLHHTEVLGLVEGWRAAHRRAPSPVIAVAVAARADIVPHADAEKIDAIVVARLRCTSALALYLTTDGETTKDPFRKVVVGRAITAPLLQVMFPPYFEAPDVQSHFTLQFAAPARARDLQATSAPQGHQSRRYSLNSASYRAPVVKYGRQIDRVKGRDMHLTAVHNLADVLELNPALSAAAAAMRLPTRTKVLLPLLPLRFIWAPFRVDVTIVFQEILREIELLPPHSGSRTSCPLTVKTVGLSL